MKEKELIQPNGMTGRDQMNKRSNAQTKLDINGELTYDDKVVQKIVSRIPFFNEYVLLS